ncbi:MAG: NAD(P)/FAD-dependent oxidoreductase [Nanoarchaeota archaeon]|nr:NAD(P)/FAD-dependent oxidoreductase [Nanoarchaeota archaeon]MBU1320915.1 NAD(P)/FAD-dependent oxidoreductase [Nanoarchaeota archaeon]MBU1597560.1 NAD(P)/FAD-dependent oxidoreductase [Nanoarchaeota archaeon]MBU2441937.1 NAD(P)/FAD-dependent oxidoreductase [Nanoarchaeota archaeon]
MKSYDVIIAGAGPAGLRCAEILAKNNKKVLVLEKNKSIGSKVCAGGITLKCLEMGIPNKIIQRKFKKAMIHTPHQTTEIKLDKPFVATINREDLGKWMAQKAKNSGAEIITDSKVTKFYQKHIVVNEKNKIGYKHLVGADGSSSIIRKQLGIKTINFAEAFHYITPKKFNNIEIFFNPDCFGAFYAWIFPHKSFTSIGTGADLSKKIKQPVFNLKLHDIKKNFDEWCSKRFDLSKARFEASIINYDYRGHDFGNKFLIGDAGGFASGLTGEGIYFAIKSGEDIARRIIDNKYNYPNIQHILKIKKIEEKIARTLERNKTISKIEHEMMVAMARVKWLNKKMVRFVD